MAELIALIGIDGILLVLFICLPALAKCGEWIYKLFQWRKNTRKEDVGQGRAEEQRRNATEERFEAGEERIEELEEKEINLETMMQNQQAQINSLIASDNLEIKHQIKKTWEKVRITRTIDSYDLDILEQQFAIYTARGGNSWAKAMMEDIRKIATTTTAIPPAEKKD